VIAVSNADRVVFPEIHKTKGDVVAYYHRIAPLALPHVRERPLSIQRFPKGLSEPGFFQKNVPAHYPESIERFAIPRSQGATKKHRDPKARERNETVFPVLRDEEHLAYVANQGAIELHVPTARVPRLDLPDRFVMDLDPPPGALDLVRRAALLVRDMLGELGLQTTPVATGSKGYHVVANLRPAVTAFALAEAAQKFGALIAAKHDELTLTFRVASRGGRVFADWLRNNPGATVVAPYSLRARPRATVATPLVWNELESTAPDAFTIDDLDRLLERPDSLATLPESDGEAFVAAVNDAFERSGLVLETFDRFRS